VSTLVQAPIRRTVAYRHKNHRCFSAACEHAATYAGLAARCCISISIRDTETIIQTTMNESAREGAKPQRFPVSCRN